MKVRAADASLLRPVSERWALQETTSAGAADFTFDVIRGPFLPAPDDMPLLFKGIAPINLPCVLRQDGENERYEIDRRASLVIGEQAAKMTIVPGEERLAACSVAFQAVNAALRLNDQYLLHAATLVLPGSESAILLFGASGAGKTTTSLCLMAAGFGLVTDDATILKRGAEGDQVWGFALPLKIHERTRKMLDWLSPLLGEQWDEEGEQQVMVRDLAGFLGQATAAAHMPRSIAAVIILGPRSEDDHQFRPTAKAEALAQILADNLARSLIGFSEHQRRRLLRITEFLRGVPTYQLRAGRNLETLPRTLMNGLTAHSAPHDPKP